MKSNFVGVVCTLLIAFLVLTISISKSISVPRAFSPMVLSEKTDNKTLDVDYDLTYPGKIAPDSSFWYLKALRDKIWLGVTLNSSKKAQLNLLFADKRLSMALRLFNKNKPDLGLSTLTKAEKYLEKAISDNIDKNPEYLNKLALASLKHRDVIENEILPISSEDLKPEVNKLTVYSRETYKKSSVILKSIGFIPPKNPFELE